MNKCKFFQLLGALAVSAFLWAGCAQTVSAPSQESAEQTDEPQEISPSSSSKTKSSSSAVAKSSLADIYDAVKADGIYTTRDSVAAYLCKFDKLPANYVNKNEGKKLYAAQGYTFSKWNFNPWTTLGVMIGGDNFDNYASDPDYYHSTLPEGHYREADVDYSGKNRGTNRLVYQPDCVIYSTTTHYSNFTLMNFD